MDLHDEIDQLDVRDTGRQMLLHALVDAGVIIRIACEVTTCKFDRTTFGTAKSPTGVSIDHIVPRRDGGSNRSNNLRLAHISCNVGRNTGRVTPPDVRKKIGDAHRGVPKPPTAKTIAANAARKGKSPTVTQAVLDARERSRGRKFSQDHSTKISNALRNKSKSAEHKQHLKDAWVGRPLVGQCARWNINRGKPCTCGKHLSIDSLNTN